MPSALSASLAALLTCLAVSGAMAADGPEPDPEPAGPWRVTCPEPEYPRAALRARAQGTTVVRLNFGADGAVSEAAVARSSGDTPSHRKLDAAAVKVMKRCRLDGGVDGKPPQFMRTVVWEVEVPPRAAARAASEVVPARP